MTKVLVVAFATAAVVFLVLDALWLGVVSRGLYQRELGPLLLAKPDFGAAIIFYVLYLAGLTYFCVMPGVADASVMRGAVNGVLFGVIAYATYDLTNLATLKGWSVTIVWVDILWGAFATAVASAAAVWASMRFAA